MHARSPLRVALRRTSLCTGLGLLTTVAVAWALAALVHLPYGLSAAGPSAYQIAYRDLRPSEAPAGYVTVSVWSGRGSALLEAQITVNNSLATLMTAPTPTPPEAIVPRWALPHTLPWLTGDAPMPSGNTVADERTVAARGWPMLALRCSFVTAGRLNTPPFRVVEVRGGLAIPFPAAPPPMFSSLPPPSALPCTPIATGLAVNTAFYAALWGALLIGPAWARRARRRRRGRCPGCGYDLRDNPAPRCPECGLNRAPPWS